MNTMNYRSMTDWKFCSLVTVRRKTLTLGLFILARWPPADAGLVFVQIEEPHQSLGATAKLHHLGPHLHGAHTFLHWRQENKTDRGKNKIGTLSKGKVCCNWKQRVTDKKCAYDMFSFKRLRVGVYAFPQNSIWALTENAVIYCCTHMNT